MVSRWSKSSRTSPGLCFSRLAGLCFVALAGLCFCRPRPGLSFPVSLAGLSPFLPRFAAEADDTPDSATESATSDSATECFDECLGETTATSLSASANRAATLFLEAAAAAAIDSSLDSSAAARSCRSSTISAPSGSSAETMGIRLGDGSSESEASDAWSRSTVRLRGVGRRVPRGGWLPRAEQHPCFMLQAAVNALRSLPVLHFYISVG